MSANIEKKQKTILHIYILIIAMPAHRTANMKGILCSTTVTWWDNLYCDAALYCLSQTASRNHHHYTAERMHACLCVFTYAWCLSPGIRRRHRRRSAAGAEGGTYGRLWPPSAWSIWCPHPLRSAPRVCAQIKRMSHYKAGAHHRLKWTWYGMFPKSSGLIWGIHLVQSP